MIDVSHDVRTAPGAGPLPRSVALPPLAASRQWHLPLTDRIGAAIAARRPGSGAARRATAPPPGLPGGEPRPAPATGPAADEVLRVASWNVHGGMGERAGRGSSDATLDALAAQIGRCRADIVLLQEVDLDAARSGWRDILGELAARLQPDGAVAAAPWIHITGRTQHVAVMTFNGARVDNARNLIHADPHGSGFLRRSARWLPSYVPRNTIDTIVRTRAGNLVRVLSGHYSGPGAHTDGRALATLALGPSLALWRGPTILGADLNVRSTSQAYRAERDALAAAGLHETFELEGVALGDAARSTTLAEAAPIDRIYVSGHFTPAGTHVRRERPAASDHDPVVTELELHAG